MAKAIHKLMEMNNRRFKAAISFFVFALLALPILTGIAQTLSASFGFFPAIGARDFSLAPWQVLMKGSGFWKSLWLSLLTGFISTALAFIISAGFCAMMSGRMKKPRLQFLAPILAAPHSAIAIGVMFLIAPSGWISRAFSPWLTGWERAPDLITNGDPYGISLIFALLVKEVPFLTLVMFSALRQLPLERHIAIGRSLGYRPVQAWYKIILPQLYPLIRLPLFIVLAFSISVVDMAMVLGPSNPPTLAVATFRLYSAPEVEQLLPASASAVLIVLLVLASILLWRICEFIGAKLGRAWIESGKRGVIMDQLAGVLSFLAQAMIVIGSIALICLAVWSISWRWSFPNSLPESWSLKNWQKIGSVWGDTAFETVKIALLVVVLSLILAILWLESEVKSKKRFFRLDYFFFVPLLLPQIAFLYGMNIFLLRAGIPASFISVVWAHFIFVFPYMLIVLSEPWRALDARLIHSAASLGASPWRRVLRVKIPILLRPILTASAIGFTVSVAQYLPTIFMGGGRVKTLTVEAVAISSGSDRRVTGLFAFLQAAIPFLVYILAIQTPNWLYRNRLALSIGAQK